MRYVSLEEWAAGEGGGAKELEVGKRGVGKKCLNVRQKLGTRKIKKKSKLRIPIKFFKFKFKMLMLFVGTYWTTFVHAPWMVCKQFIQSWDGVFVNESVNFCLNNMFSMLSFPGSQLLSDVQTFFYFHLKVGANKASTPRFDGVSPIHCTGVRPIQCSGWDPYNVRGLTPSMYCN